jgi:hypothetical protein
MYRAQLSRAARPKTPFRKKIANASFVGNRTERFALQKKLGVSGCRAARISVDKLTFACGFH